MIDDTPEGQPMHGVLASFNEFRSAADGADIRYKMAEKAKRGGTLGLAPIGYLNVRVVEDGREIRTVDVDPERGPLVSLAFDLYASGNYTLEGLADELTTRGLRTRPTARSSAKPVSESLLSNMLRNPYYIGIVTHKGETYEGRHQPLVTEAVFSAVQEVLALKRTSGERYRVHHHYLKGSVWCDECRRAGRNGRLILNLAKGGAGGHYRYFFCRQRQEGRCDAPYFSVDSVDSVEAAIVDHYRSIRFAPAFIEQVQAEVDEVLSHDGAADRLRRAQVQSQLRKLDAQEENLLDLAADGELSTAKVRSRLLKIRLN